MGYYSKKSKAHTRAGRKDPRYVEAFEWLRDMEYTVGEARYVASEAVEYLEKHPKASVQQAIRVSLEGEEKMPKIAEKGKEQFGIWDFKEGKAISTKGKAIKIKGFEEFNFFVARPIDYKGEPITTAWEVFETRTGMSTGGRGKTQTTAIKEATNRISKAGKENIERAIASGLETHKKAKPVKIPIEKAKPSPRISYSKVVKAYDSKQEAHKAVLEGFRNLEEAKEHAQGMRGDDVTFTAKGIPIDKKVLLTVIAKEAKPEPKAKLALPTLKIPKKVTSYKEYAELKQTSRGRATDMARQHSVVIEPGSPKTKQWLKDPSSADIRGVDTPSVSKRGVLGRKGTLRITPKTPRLRR